jgi:small neutral amino acid transporter SnatA (MarC family)
MEGQAPQARIAELERGFRRAGLPLFIEDYSATTDVYNRVVPLLGLVFIGEMLGALNFEWSPVANVAAALGGLVILLVAVALINRRNGNPSLAVPDRVGKTELAGFVLLPALLPLIFGGQWLSALVTAAANLLLLAVIYAVVGYGLIWIVRWVMGRLAAQLSSSLGLIAKALPLLLIFALLSFTTQEAWEIFPGVTTPIYFLIIALFVVLGTLFLGVRIPSEARHLEREAGGEAPPLDRRQRFNVGLVMFVSQAVQVLVVSAALGAFFVAFGLLAINDEVRTSWLGNPGDVLVQFELLGERLEVTKELLRVAGGLAAFSGFYFAIAVFTDSTYRGEFLDEMSSEMRDTFRARAEYCELRGVC